MRNMLEVNDDKLVLRQVELEGPEGQKGLLVLEGS